MQQRFSVAHPSKPKIFPTCSFTEKFAGLYSKIHLAIEIPYSQNIRPIFLMRRDVCLNDKLPKIP